MICNKTNNFLNWNDDIKYVDLEMTDNKRRGQHYNPIFYLKHFSTERKGEYYIKCFNKETGQSFESNIKNIGKENWFYSRDSEFERILSQLDAHHSTVYKIIEEHPIYLWIESEKRTIAEFIYLTAARTRRARQNRMEINEDVIHDENFRKGFRYVFPGKNIEEEIEETRRVLQLSVMFDVNTMVTNPNAAQMIETMTNYDYFIFKNDSSMKYYTSDHPIPHFDMSDEEGYKVVFPLTPKWCLVLYNGKKLMDDYPTQIIIASEEFVKGANKAMIQVAHNYIYSKNNGFEFVKKYMENHKNNDREKN